MYDVLVVNDFSVSVLFFVHAGVDCRSGGEFPASSTGLPSIVRERGSVVVEYLSQPRERALHVVVVSGEAGYFLIDCDFQLLILKVLNTLLV